MSNDKLQGVIKELEWVYWIFPGVFLSGLVIEIILYQMCDIAPLSTVALTVFWALFGYAAQTLVLHRTIRTLKMHAS